MNGYAHPADYMTDASYEEFRRAGGISCATMDADIQNYSLDPTEEILVESYSGAPEDVSDRVVGVAVSQYDDLATRQDVYEYLDEELEGGDWITIVDGEIEELGEFCPYRLHVRLYR